MTVAPEAEPARADGPVAALSVPARQQSPNTIPWPPVLLVLAAGLGLLSRRVVPDLPQLPGQMIVGGLSAILGVAMIVAALVGFARHRANVLPHRAADTLITTGVFRLSRNPIYAGEVLALAGLGVVLGAPGVLVAAIFLAVAVGRLGIRREEAHLLARFGDDWRAYRRRVRRWL